MTDHNLTNKELIRFRRSEKVRQLALSEEHERTHTGTAVLRRVKLGVYENTLDSTPCSPVKVTPEELLQAMMRECALAAKENITKVGVKDTPVLHRAASIVAAQFGLAHSQIPSLVEDMLHYMEHHHVHRFK